MTATIATPVSPGAWEHVDHTGYVLLTTWKKDGTAVSVPVWAVRDGARLLVITAEDSGKAKRVRANGRAALAPSDRKGTRLGADVPARGQQLPKAEVERLRPLFLKRYGMMARLIFTVHKVRFRGMTSVLLEFLPAEA